MIKIGAAAAVFFWVAFILAAHPQYLQSVKLDLALAGPLIFAIVYLRNLGLFIADLRRYLKVRFLVRETKKDKKQHPGIPSPI